MQNPAPGVVENIAPGLRRVLARNPSPMTYWGTNTFLLGESEVAVVDPGPDDPVHLNAIRDAALGPITTILITHPHLDHSPGAARLSAETGAKVLGFGPAASGIPAKMSALQNIGGGEGVDDNFRPDHQLRDGDQIAGEDWDIAVKETPGHFAGHLAFVHDDWVLSGDHAMAWASTLISPPHGDLGDFRRTSESLIDLAPRRFFPSHGPELENPSERLHWLLEHRQSREDQIFDTLTEAPQDLPTLTRTVYHDIDPRMMLAAERNVLAHLIDLVERSAAATHGEITLSSKFTRI